MEMKEQEVALRMISMADVQSQEVRWLWYPFIPKELHLQFLLES